MHFLKKLSQRQQKGLWQECPFPCQILYTFLKVLKKMCTRNGQFFSYVGKTYFPLTFFIETIEP